MEKLKKQSALVSAKKRDASKIKVSVIIPFYNRVDWTIDAIKSALLQTHDKLEIIVVNDHSTDKLEPIIETSRSDSRIIFIENKWGKGVSGARNSGVDVATGEYIVFLDSDDLFYPDKVEKQLLFMIENSIYFSHTGYEYFSTENLPQNVTYPEMKDFSYPEIISGCSIATPTVMIHRSLVEDDSLRFPLHISIGEDICFWIELTKKTPCICLREVLTKVRLHDSNAAHDNFKQIQGINDILSYVIKNDLDETSIESIKKLNETLICHIGDLFPNTGSVAKDPVIKETTLNFSKLKKNTKKVIKKIIYKVSPTNRLLVENRENIYSILGKVEAIEHLTQSNDQSIIKILESTQTSLNNQQTIEKKIDQINKDVVFYANSDKYRLNTIIGTGYNAKDFVSIICLIYKSTKFAKAVYDSLYEFTPKLRNGEAELLFVANDATPEVKSFLKKEKYNFIVNDNPIYSDDVLFKQGYGKPEYISRVYRGYNFGIKKCKGNIVVLINSDNMFSPDWLENLLSRLDKNTVVCSQLVERNHPKFSVFPGAIHGEFGDHPDNFKKQEFLEFVKEISQAKTIPNGAYMPSLTYKSNYEKVGYYPEGNIAGKTFDEVIRYGDEYLYDKFAKIGVEHITVCDSISYHFKEGERED